LFLSPLIRFQPPFGIIEVDCKDFHKLLETKRTAVINLRDPEIGRAPLPVCLLSIREYPYLHNNYDNDDEETVAVVRRPRLPKVQSKKGSFVHSALIFLTTPLIRIKKMVSFDLDKVTGIFYYSSKWQVTLLYVVVGVLAVALSADADADCYIENVAQRNWLESVACTSFKSSELIINVTAGAGVASERVSLSLFDRTVVPVPQIPCGSSILRSTLWIPRSHYHTSAGCER
jgi:hypothetical protein